MNLYAVTRRYYWSYEYDMETVSIHSTQELADAAAAVLRNDDTVVHVQIFVLDEAAQPEETT